MFLPNALLPLALTAAISGNACTTSSSSPPQVPASEPTASRESTSEGSATPPTAAATTSDTARPDASSNAGAPAANSGTCNAALCEDFEASATLDVTRWETVSPMCSGTGKLALDTTQAHSGSRSIRIDGAGGFCNHVFLRPAAARFPASDPLFVRFYLRISTALTQAHVSFVALRDEHDNSDLRMGGQAEIMMWNRQSDDATLPELSPTGIGMSAKPPANTWLCVELSINGASGELHTWLDGQAVAGLTVDGDATPNLDAQWKRKADWHPKLSDVRFGWESYGSDANTLWFDDLAIGPTRIGCLP